MRNIVLMTICFKLNQCKKALLVKIHPDRVHVCTARVDHYATFVHDGIAVAMMELENITARYMYVFSGWVIGVSKKFPRHRNPKAEQTEAPTVAASSSAVAVDAGESAEADVTWSDAGAKVMRPPKCCTQKYH